MPSVTTDAWPVWCDAANTLTLLPNASVTGNNIWYYWTTGTGTATNQAISVQLTATNHAVWSQWTTGYTVPMVPYQTPIYVPLEPTPEERAAQEAARQEALRRYEEQQRERREADKRAEALLRAHLSDEQRAEYELGQVFHVRSRSGRLYRVTRGWSGNVFELREEPEVIAPDGRVQQNGAPRLVEVARYCIHPREYTPDADNMLAQALLLQADEEEFLRIANRTRLAG